MFVLKSGARVKDSWVNVRYENSQQLYTYHFDSEGCMDTGFLGRVHGSSHPFIS